MAVARTAWATLLRAVPQKWVALVFDIAPRSVREWSCPRNEDGTYNLTEVVRWYVGREVQAIIARYEQADGDGLVANSKGPHADLYLKYKALEKQHQYYEKIKQCVRVEDVRGCLESFATALRSSGGELEKRYGPDAREILENAIKAGGKAMALYLEDVRKEVHHEDAPVETPVEKPTKPVRKRKARAKKKASTKGKKK